MRGPGLFGRFGDDFSAYNYYPDAPKLECEDCGKDITWRWSPKTGLEVCPSNCQPRFCLPCRAERRRMAKREKYRTDPEFRERKLAQDAEYRADPDNRRRKRLRDRRYQAAKREQINAAKREKYRTDPEFRQRAIERSRARQKANRPAINAAYRERYRTDPEFRAKRLASQRRSRARRKAAGQ